VTADGNDARPIAEPGTRRAHVLETARRVGFAAAAVADASPPVHLDALRRWIAEGRHGEMAWIADRIDLLADPSRLLEGARSVIVVADRYHDGRPDRRVPGLGRIGRYARGRDYHRTVRRRLEQLVAELQAAMPNERFRICVDTAPLLEREFAARSGLARIGKHTLAIARGLGSWTLLGEVLTTAEIASTDPDPAPDPCGTCTRCLEACPTDAITPYSVDATRCVSYLTIEHRGEIPPEFHEGIGDWIFGCDLCQEVCPHNQPTRAMRRGPIEPDHAPRRSGFDLLEVLGWTEEDRRVACTTSALKRAKLPMFRRNAVIAATNLILGGDLDSELERALRRRLEEMFEELGVAPILRAALRTSKERLEAGEPLADAERGIESELPG